MTTYELWPLSEVCRKLKYRNLSMVARETGVSRNAITRLANEQTHPDKVSFGVVTRLMKYLQET